MTDPGHGGRATPPSERNGERPPLRPAARYDAVVIGTGIGGLTCAALLARSGRRVLAVERHDRVGGYAHSFRRGPYLFDAAVHLVGGCEDGGLIDQLLTSLGVRQRCQFESVDPCYRAEFPGFALAAPTGLAEFRAAHQEAFPDEAGGIASYLDDCATIRDETRRLMSGTQAAAQRTLEHFPTLHRLRRSTVEDALQPVVTNPRARAALTALWPYVGLPPKQMSFLYWASMLMSYVEDGSYYCKGTFQVFADTLADVVREAGGDVLLRTAVRSIETDTDGVRAVTLDGGRRIATQLVLSNADMRQTVEELVGADRFPARYRRHLDRLRPSVSAVVAYLATDLPAAAISAAHETFAFDSWDHGQSYDGTMNGSPSWYTLTVPTTIDPSLAPQGETLVVYTTLVAFDAVSDWRSNKQRYHDRIAGQLEARVPGSASRIKILEIGTPQTMLRYTCNSAGALYGWELSPDQIGPTRPSSTAPVPGLYLAGHWTQPGGGIYGVVTSGVLAARAMLGLDSDEDLWNSLR